MKNIKNGILSFILFFAIAVSSYAQSSDLYFDHINYDTRFSQSMISSIHQTKKGFIWIGTANGLISYDGYDFLRYVYNKDILNSISNNHVNVILEDNKREIWVGTNNGLNLFNKNEKSFLRVDVQKIKGGRNYISSIIQDDQDRIWVGTFGGIKRLDRQKYVLEEISNDHNSPFRKSRVLSLFYDRNYGVLVGTSKGLECFDPKNGSKKALPKVWSDNTALLKSKIWKILKEKNGDVWFATEANGVFHFDASQNSVTNFLLNTSNRKSLSSNWVNDIVEVDANTIWFATKNGLCVYKKDRNEFTKYGHNALESYSLSDDDVKCFLKDRHNDIWIGTNGGGVNFFQKTNTNFTSVREVIKPNFGLNTAFVNAVARENDGSVWVGTNGGGLNYLDFKNNKSTSYVIESYDFDKSVNMITALVNQNEQYLFCGTFNGLFKFNKNSKTFQFISLSRKDSKERERPITSLLMDNGDLWVGTNGNGLKKVMPDGTVEIYMADGTSNSLSDNFITDIINRKDGLWIATQYGLNYFDKKLKQVTKVFKTGSKNGLSNNSLTVMFTDSKNRFWIGAESGGVNLFDERKGRFFEINRSMGFTDETIKSISEDSEGNIWISDNNLLYKIKTKKLSPAFRISDFEITSYSSKDGLKVKQFSNNCSLKLNAKELVFGCSNGLVLFNPSKLIKTEDKAPIVLTKLIVNNEEIKPGNKEVTLEKRISETSEITLKHDQGYIGIEFSAMNFISPEKSEYAYKLESSFNKDDWHIIGSQHYINLTNLNSGTYLLKIKTSNGGGEWNPTIKTLKIIMLPPWWKTWWAYILYLGLLAGAAVLLFRFLRNRELLKQTYYLDQVEKERQEELYKMKLDFFTNVSHEIRTPLTLISGPVEELLSGAEKNSNLEHKLKTIKSNSDRLLKLVNELMDFRKAEKGSMKIYCEQQDIVSFCFDIYESFRGIAVEKKIDYKFVLNINTALLYFDKNQMEKVIYNLLSNAFKFTSKNGKITLAVEQKEDSDSIEIKVKDNGIGIPENRKKKIFKNFFQLDERGSANLGSGIGLALSKSIVELHHGEIKVQTEADANFNTIFTITLKKGKEHFKKSQIVENTIKIDENANPISDIKTEIDIYEPEYLDESDNSTKKTVLVIEDNEEVLSFINDILYSDYKVLRFTDAIKALEYMEKEIPDLILTDVMMPEMDGFELCKILKTNQNTNHIPVILLTAKSSTLNRIEGLSTGADAYISKPFSIEELKLTIANLLSAKEIMRQKYGEGFIADAEQENASTPEGQFVKKLTQIIEANLDNTDFDVNDLVNEIGMSRTVLYKKVQMLTNHSVAGFIKNMRLKKAASLLSNTSYSVSEVTYMVGFNDRKHFSKEFKKFYNLSPTEYKSAQVKN